ncbi:MAG: hypothetical protein HY577_01595 [Candidatus Nealsonbacteria bacterium]|nr:hypothetical protein [Candidatus Nealsonbacteria bacterium]
MTQTFLRKNLAGLVLISLVFGFLPALPVSADNTLFADISATPSSGFPPLNNVSLTAVVSGTATGNITYKFDCASDGVWDLTQVSANTTYTAVNLCNYPAAGNYTATIKVERENLSFQGTIAILVQAQLPPTVDIKANGSDGPVTIGYNTAATLSWTSTNATSCSASGNWSGAKSTSGSESSGNLTNSATYTITCTGAGGTASDSVTVNVQNPAPTVDIKANGSDGPVTIGYNTAATLSWTSTNATSCTAAGDWSGSKAISGSESTGNLTSSKTYTITCSGTGGTAADTVTVLVQTPPAPTVDLKVNGSDGTITIDFNTAATLSWTSTNATSCTAAGDWSGSKAISGSESTGSLTTVKTYNYSLTCTGVGGSASDSVAVIVNTQPALYVTLEASPNVGVAPLNGVNLRATVTGSATGLITYRFDCTADGSWDYVISTNEIQQQTGSLCNYPNIGSYRARVQVQRSNLTVEGTSVIQTTASSSSQTPTLFVTLQAQPNTGSVPLSSVLTATVSGTVTGNTVFKFDCTSDGIWENTVSTAAATASYACLYSAINTYTAKVQADRGGLTIWGNSTIVTR